MVKKKTLSERIATQLSAAKETSGARNKAVFISMKPEIEKAMIDGWSLRQIWRTLNSEGSITFTYETFRKYANKHISIEEKEEESVKEDLTPEEKTGKSGFQFNSTADKKDLL